MRDGATKLFLSTKGTASDIPKPLKVFLDYVDGCEPDDELTVEMDRAVKTAKNRDEWRRAYMTLYLEMEREKEEARKEAREECKIQTAQNLIKAGVITYDKIKESGLYTDRELSAIKAPGVEA